MVWHDSYVAEQHVHHYGKSSGTGLLVAGRLRQRLRQRVPRTGRSTFARRRASARAHAALSRSSAGTRRAGATSWRRFARTFTAAPLAARSSGFATPCTERLQELDRRERLVAKRERELNLLRERVARHAASKHFIAGSAVDAGRAGARGARRAARHDRAGLRRERHRQGIHRPDDSRSEPARQRPVRVASTARR